MDAIWSYGFLYKVRQVHSYSEQHTHLQNFDTGRLISERIWTDDVMDTEHWNASTRSWFLTSKWENG